MRKVRRVFYIVKFLFMKEVEKFTVFVVGNSSVMSETDTEEFHGKKVIGEVRFQKVLLPCLDCSYRVTFVTASVYRFLSREQGSLREISSVA